MVRQTKLSYFSTLLALQLLPGCGMFNGKGVINQKVGSFLGVVDPTAAKTPTDTLKAGVLAIGADITAELGANLTSAGLTDTEAGVILSGANQQLGVSTGKIAIASLHLADGETPQPIMYAAAPIVQGAVSVLSDTKAGLADLTKRTAIAKVIMGSTFSSLGGRVGSLPTDSLLSLQKDMIGSAVKSLNDGGLGGDSAVGAVRALTSGAVENLGKSVSGSGASAAAAGVASGAVESLTSNGLPLDQIGAMVSAATAGVVSSLQKAGINDTAGAASAIAKSSVTSLKSLAMSEANVLLATTGAASGAIGALTATGVAIDKIADIAKQVATASVGALRDAGVSSTSLGKAAGAVASGAIQGLTNAGMTATQIADTKSVSAICVGAAGGLSASGVDSTKVGSAIGEIASSAVGAMSTAMSKATLAQQQSVMGDVMNGSAQGILASGLSKNDSLAAMTNVTQKSVEALPPKVFSADALSSMAATVVGQGIANSLSVGIVAASDASKMASAVGAAVGAGAANTNIGIDTNAMLKQISAAATSAGITDASSMMTSAFSGAATGAALASGNSTNSVVSGLNAAVNSGAAFTGVSGVDTSSLSGNLQQAVTSANTLATTVGQGNLPGCAAVFPDSLSNDDLFAKIKVAPQPVVCSAAKTSASAATAASTATICPIARNDGHVSTYWTSLGTTGVCQFVLTVIAGGSAATLLPSCSQFGAIASINGYSGFYNNDYSGVPCIRTTAAASCPALPPDAGATYSWVSLTVATTGDACLMIKQGTGSSASPSAGTGSGAGSGSSGGFSTFPSGLTASSVIPTCTSLGINAPFALSGLNAMFNPPSSLNDFYCRVPNASACVSAQPSLSGFVYGPDQFGWADGTSVCHYSVQSPSCQAVFGNLITVGDSQVQAAVLASGKYSPVGDLSCYAATCPVLMTSANFTFASQSLPAVSATQCMYSRNYNICNFSGGQVNASNLSSYTPFISQKSFICKVVDSGSQGGDSLAGPFVAAGLVGPMRWGSPNGTRSVVSLGGQACADAGITGTVTSANISQLNLLGNSFAVGCDVPLASTCPAVDAATLPNYMLTSTSFPAMNVNRCTYTKPQATCPGTLSAGWSNIDLNRTMNANGRGYACDTTSTCPSFSTPPGDFKSYTVSRAGGSRCLYTTSVPLCSDAATGGVIDNIYSLAQDSNVFSCDLPLASGTCPSVGSAYSGQYTPPAGPVSIISAAFGRCYYRPTLPTCQASTITSLTSLVNYNYGPGTTKACETNPGQSCPMLSTSAFGNSVNGSIPPIVESPLNRSICLFQPYTSIGNFNITSGNQNISSNPVGIAWATADGADTYSVGISGTPACSGQTILASNVVGNSTNINLPGSGSFYVCVTAMSTHGLSQLQAMSSISVNSSIVGPMSAQSTFNVPASLPNGASTNVILQAVDAMGAPIMNETATVTWTADNLGGSVSIVTSGYAGNGQYYVQVTGASLGLVKVTAHITDSGAPFDLQSPGFTISTP